ncbi:hypothetical protein PVAP13_1NG177100 [Panicum virgatum]|uniref:Uncharacterized protein n=1 Tax=Panicum virgatum TaxID=38727 RepID=A0A8T0WRF9_PANVG|nr:hypothetical protein PVAP13_1NG177100 [Panicum virgatum]
MMPRHQCCRWRWWPPTPPRRRGPPRGWRGGCRVLDDVAKRDLGGLGEAADEVEHLTAVPRDGLRLRRRAPPGGRVRPSRHPPPSSGPPSPNPCPGAHRSAPSRPAARAQAVVAAALLRIAAAGHPAHPYQLTPPDQGSQRGGREQPWSCLVQSRP